MTYEELKHIMKLMSGGYYIYTSDCMVARAIVHSLEMKNHVVNTFIAGTKICIDARKVT